MADVAERAQVSKKTVSAVVNGVGQVSEATRDRVRAAVAELGYLPNPVARRLSAARAGTITLALPHLASGDLAALASAVIAAAERSGVGVLCEPTGGGADREADVLRPGAGVSDGVLLVPSTSSFVLPDRVPVVVLGDRDVEPAVDRVLAPAGESVARALDLVAGSRRPVLLVAASDRDLVPAGVEVVRARDGSAGAGFDAMSAALPPAPDHGGDHTVLAVPAARGPLHAPDVPGTSGVPDAVVALGSGLALGALHALRVAGRAVPSDVRVVSVGAGVESAYADPALTTVAPDVEAMAERAVARLLARIDGDTTAPHRLDVPVVVTPRSST